MERRRPTPFLAPCATGSPTPFHPIGGAVLELWSLVVTESPAPSQPAQDGFYRKHEPFWRVHPQLACLALSRAFARYPRSVSLAPPPARCDIAVRAEIGCSRGSQSGGRCLSVCRRTDCEHQRSRRARSRALRGASACAPGTIRLLQAARRPPVRAPRLRRRPVRSPPALQLHLGMAETAPPCCVRGIGARRYLPASPRSSAK